MKGGEFSLTSAYDQLSAAQYEDVYHCESENVCVHSTDLITQQTLVEVLVM